jgi:CRP/FNR family transcriptional regulator
MKDYSIECQNCFFRTNLCKSLSKREFRQLFKLTKQKIFEKGEVIFKQDEKTEYLVFLTHGITKLVYNNHGKDLIIAIEKPQTLLGLANILNENINFASIIAVEDCKGCLIDIEKFKEIMIKNRQFLLEIMGISTRMFRKSIFNFISIAHKQSNGRIADVLLSLSENIYNRRSFCLSLSRQELADFAGCSKELVIRTLQNFCTDGIINISGKNIEILDVEQLRRISKIG